MQIPRDSTRVRARTVILMSVIVIGAAVAFIRLGAKLTATPSGVDVVTYHNDIARTGRTCSGAIAGRARTWSG
jgi:hypothetical protein